VIEGVNFWALWLVNTHDFGHCDVHLLPKNPQSLRSLSGIFVFSAPTVHERQRFLLFMIDVSYEDGFTAPGLR